MRPAKWLHNENPVDMITINTEKEISGTGHRYIGDSISASLHIDNARLEDDGMWKCIIETDRGELLSGRLVKLVILGKLKNHLARVSLFYFHFTAFNTGYPDFFTLKYSSIASLNCRGLTVIDDSGGAITILTSRVWRAAAISLVIFHVFWGCYGRAINLSNLVGCKTSQSLTTEKKLGLLRISRGR